MFTQKFSILNKFYSISSILEIFEIKFKVKPANITFFIGLTKYRYHTSDNTTVTVTCT